MFPESGIVAQRLSCGEPPGVLSWAGTGGMGAGGLEGCGVLVGARGGGGGVGRQAGKQK